MNGPEFLKFPEEQWPVQTTTPHREEDMERRRVKVVCEVKNVEQAIDPKKFSSWKKLIRVTALIRRLAMKIRLRKHDQDGRGGPLTPEELQQAEFYWIKQAQSTLHSRLERGDFKPLSPSKDANEVIRVGGRVDEAIVSYETRHPALLPSGNQTRPSVRTHRCGSYDS